MPEELEKVIRDLPRDPETIDLFKKLAGADPSVSRHQLNRSACQLIITG
jgi:hypothetical protein